MELPSPAEDTGEQSSRLSKESGGRDDAFAVHSTSFSDQATGDDSLGFKPYVTAIAEFLLNPDTKPPLTLSVEGEWGSGKSSFMKQLDLYLREKGQRTVWFNAWRHDKAEAVWAAFALSFIKQISTPKENSRKAYWEVFQGHVRLMISRFDLTKGWLELSQVALIALFVICAALAIPFILAIYGVAGISQLIQALKSPDQILQAILYVLGIAGGGSISMAGLLTLLKKIPSILGSPKLNLIKYLKSPNYNKQSAFIEEFHEDFAKIVDAYIGDGKVFVFIDDLDRCEHPKAADLMQAINLMIADDPSVVFILGMDREKVAASLAVKYEQILAYLPSETQEIDPDILARRNLDRGLAYGYSFIEKFVQLPFQIPQPSLKDFDQFFEQLTASKKSPSSTSEISPQKSFLALSKVTWPWSRQSTQPLGQIQSAQKNQEVNPIEGSRSGNIVQVDLGAIAQTEATPLQIQTQKRLETIQVKFGQDSPAVRDVIRMVAPFFDYNPRRIKQFLNLFRLKVYIAYLTGLFDRIEDGEGNIVQEALTVPQLAKFTAISLKHPLFLLDLKSDLNLLQRIHYSCEIFPKDVETHELPKESLYSQKWKRNYPKLTELITYGYWSEYYLQERDCPTEPYQPPDPQFSLADLNVEMLLKISPQVIRSNAQASVSQQQVTNSNIELSIPDQQAIIEQILSQMVDIPAGRFLMGSEEHKSEQPIHEVYISAFQIGKYPVTQEQYQAIMGNNPSHFQDNPNNPVENVSWDDAQAFCQKLKEMTGKDFRLPTEAEWEYACRAEIPPTPLNKGGSSTRYCFGDDEKQLGDYAWFAQNSDSKTHPVGEKKPNAWGLYDMHGNVWEWCADPWHNSYAEKPENIKNNSNTIWSNSNESRRVLRGGSWLNLSRYCRSAVRLRRFAVNRSYNIGFRLVLLSF